MTDELAALIELVGKSGFMLHAFRGDRHGPDGLAAVRDCRGCVDVVIIYDEEHACAYRVPSSSGVDPFAPSQVFWSYASSSVWTLRALLTLAPPGHPQAPAELGPAPNGIGIPPEWRERVRVRKRG